MNRKNAFTLIEVLVVVAIIALLIGILMPSLSRARAQARLTTCGTNLHQIGVAMMAYLQDSRDHMPSVSYMPSIGRSPLPPAKKPDGTDAPPVYFATDVLRKYMPSGKKLDNASGYPAVGMGGAYECPDDRPNSNPDRLTTPSTLTYYQSERISYEYRTSLNGVTPTEFAQHAGGAGWRRRHDANMNLPTNTIWFARDFWNFHAPEQKFTGTDLRTDSTTQGTVFVKGVFPARRYAYIDGHVADYEN